MASVDIDDNIDTKEELRELRKKLKKFDTLYDYNTISYQEFIVFVFNTARKFDKRLDKIEARLDAIDLAFENALNSLPVKF
jgi:hypothetical protein